MMDTRPKSRLALFRTAVGRAVGECLHYQRAKQQDNRWTWSRAEPESATRSGDVRTRLPR
jgi:hypothetical protein